MIEKPIAAGVGVFFLIFGIALLFGLTSTSGIFVCNGFNCAYTPNQSSLNLGSVFLVIGLGSIAFAIVVRENSPSK